MDEECVVCGAICDVTFRTRDPFGHVSLSLCESDALYLWMFLGEWVHRESEAAS